MSQKTKYFFCFPTFEEFSGIVPNSSGFSPSLECQVTGLGVMTTAFHAGKLMTLNPNCCFVLLGLAGTYSNKLALGTCTQVMSSTIIDFGAENEDGTRIPYHNIVPSVSSNTAPWSKRELINSNPMELLDFPKVKSLTVPYTSGSSKTIERRKKMDCEIETMEDAGFIYAALQCQVQFTIIRAVSNKVEVRNKDSWEIQKAFKSLQSAMETLIHN